MPPEPPRLVTALAPAKLNLDLRVLGKRDDGYHELASLFVGVGIYDTLRFRASDESGDRLQVRGGGADVSAGADNLVLRAAAALRERAEADKRECPGASIELTKRIPSQAGLGGGSSDAAATLVSLNSLWGLGFGKPVLHEVAAGIGSDVNFFVEQRPVAVCTGRGEIVRPIRCSNDHWFTVVKPSMPAATGAIFSAFSHEMHRNGHSPPYLRFGQNVKLNDLRIAATRFANVLQTPAIQVTPGLGEWLRRLRRVTRSNDWRMTGSGTSFFAAASTRRQAGRMARSAREVDAGDLDSGRTRTFIAPVASLRLFDSVP